MQISRPKIALAIAVSAVLLVITLVALTPSLLTRTPPVRHACSGGPAPDFGITFETTDPNGRFTCIKPPSDAVIREINNAKLSEWLVELAPAILRLAVVVLAFVTFFWVVRRATDYW